MVARFARDYDYGNQFCDPFIGNIPVSNNNVQLHRFTDHNQPTEAIHPASMCVDGVSPSIIPELSPSENSVFLSQAPCPQEMAVIPFLGTPRSKPKHGKGRQPKPFRKNVYLDALSNYSFSGVFDEFVELWVDHVNPMPQLPSPAISLDRPSNESDAGEEGESLTSSAPARKKLQNKWSASRSRLRKKVQMQVLNKIIDRLVELNVAYRGEIERLEVLVTASN